MNRAIGITLYALFATVLSASASAQNDVIVADDLWDVYQLATQTDPSIREAEANLMAAREEKPLARSSLLPQLSLNAQFDQNNLDGTDTSQINVDPDTGNPIDPPIPFSRPLDGKSESAGWNVQLQQSIFRWDQWMALKQSDYSVAQAEAQYQSAVQDLMVRVAATYFDVLAAQDTLRSEEGALEAIERQLEQAEKRFEVGLSAITDVQESRAERDRGRAVVIDSKRNLATAKEFLREIVGVYFESLSEPGESIPLVSPDPADEQAWVDISMDQNLNLIAARIGADIARQQVKINRAGHYPSLDLTYSHGEFDFEDGTNPALIFPFQRDATSDRITLNFTLPLYVGGNTSSQVRRSVHQHRASKEQLERVARETERQARDSYLGVMAEISRVQALNQAVKSSQTALEATEAGFEVGTRTTVDVLNGRRDLLASETEFFRSRYDYILNVLRLKQAAGTLKEDDVQEVNGWLK